MSVNTLDHVWFWVGDMDRAVVFYRDVLELGLMRRDGDEWAEFDAGAVRLALHGAGPGSAPGGTAVFRVDDLVTARARLEERGVTFDHAGEVDGYARYATFRDPFGNGLQLIEFIEGGG
ncbi:MAG TPA: VOC family protein [Actinomycetota bacterium]|nr:VOC family protein [Actinomycetota bacterium]